MWTLTPEYVEQVKEELKGRRAAIQARYADELKALEADIADIETLERIAYAFAVKHLPEPGEPQPALDPEAVVIAELQPAAAVEAEPEAEGKGLSRWRMRLDAHSDAEPA